MYTLAGRLVHVGSIPSVYTPRQPDVNCTSSYTSYSYPESRRRQCIITVNNSLVETCTMSHSMHSGETSELSLTNYNRTTSSTRALVD